MDRAPQAAVAPKQTYAERLIERAIFEFTDKLIVGETVGGCSFRDLLDSEIDSRGSIFLQELDTLLCGEGGSDTVEGYASTLRDKIIERYLNTPRMQDAIQVRADEMFHEDGERFDDELEA